MADFARTQRPPVWTPPPSEIKRLRALVRYMDKLQDECQREQNGQSSPAARFIHADPDGQAIQFARSGIL